MVISMIGRADRVAAGPHRYQPEERRIPVGIAARTRAAL
jgi:hypothetical protein